MMQRIALDAMGGDGAPRTMIEGALSAVREWPDRFRVVLVGDADRLASAFPQGVPGGLEIAPASQVVEQHESPVRAVRRKPDSSIVVGLGLVKEGLAQAFISAGPTGAVMAASRFVLGMLAGVERPAVGTMLPTATSPTLLVDAGANIDTRPSHLLQFAHLGSVYVRDLMDLERPRVGLLNVGEEPGKGDERAVIAYKLLQDDPDLNFVGNVEGHRVLDGVCDVLVTDGFAGNVLLKFFESMAGFVSGLLEAKLDAGRSGPGLADVYRTLDYTERGGAPLLGVDGVCVICHGASPPNAIKNAIRIAATCVESGMVEDMAEDLGSMSRTARVWRRIRRR